MSKIKIFGMGGLNENGKNTYIVEVDDKIFVFDAGLKYANDTMYGIDYIIPDYDYLEKNKNRIVGVFITHAHPESYGGVRDLIKDIKDIKIYATKYAINQMKLDGINEKNLNLITAHKKIVIDKETSVFAINVNHSVPDSVMYVLNTKDGAVVYTGDFIIDPSMMGSYYMDLGKIAYVGKQGVLALLCESSFSENKGHTSPNHHMSSFFKNIINKAQGRVIFSVLPIHLYTIEGIFTAAKNSHRKIIIMGKKLQNIINMAIKEKNMNIDEKLIGDLSNLDDSNAILLVSDDRAHPYSSIEKIVNGNDKFIHLKETDTFCFAEPKYDENEKIIVKLENNLGFFGKVSRDNPLLKDTFDKIDDKKAQLEMLKQSLHHIISGE